MTRQEWARSRTWLIRAITTEAALVALFIICCGVMANAINRIPTKEYSEPLVVVKEVPVEVTVAPIEETDDGGPSETVIALAQTVWGEARGCSTTEQAAVVWCVLNRVDSEDPYFPDDPLSVVKQSGQFAGYHPGYPVVPELVALVEDVMGRWELEKTAIGNVGRVLPKEYLFFHGDGTENIFRVDFEKGVGSTWDWSLESPYE